jgi:hypothetical protein
MSDDNQDVNQNDEAESHAGPDLLSQLLSERKASYEKEVEVRKTQKEEEKEGEQKSKEKPVAPQKEEPKSKPEKQKTEPAAKPEESIKGDKNKKVADEDDDDDDDEEETGKPNKSNEELEKAKKSLADTHRWGKSISRKVSAALKELQEEFDAGEITEAQFEKFRTALQSDHPEPKQQSLSDNENPLSKLINIAAAKLEYLKDALGDDELFDEKVKAFDFFMDNASPEERRELYDELEELEEKPVKLAKKLFSIGEQHHEFYKQVSEAGGVRKLIESKEKKIESKQKTIDKLQKKLAQYEDYDKPTNRIKELGLNTSAPEPKEGGDLLTQVLSEHSRQVRNRSRWA